MLLVFNRLRQFIFAIQSVFYDTFIHLYIHAEGSLTFSRHSGLELNNWVVLTKCNCCCLAFYFFTLVSAYNRIFSTFFVFKFAELNAPFKKRRSKYMAETTPAPPDHLLCPLSPITPPLPEDSLHPLLHTRCGSLLPNGVVYSPMPSLPASRCNTPLQFEVRA